jgi:hypothetical protein
MQIDLSSVGGYAGGDKKVTGANDHARASVTYNSEGFKLNAGLGYLYDRRDTPTTYMPNYYDSMYQTLRINGKAGPIYLNLDQSLLVGSTSTTYPATDRTGLGLTSVFAMPGISFLNNLIYAGGVVGDRNGNARIGGFAGLALHSGNHRVGIRGQYVAGSGNAVLTDGLRMPSDGASATATYLYSTSGNYGIGATGFYASGNGNHVGGGSLLGVIPVAGKFSILPAAGVMPTSATVGFGGSVMFMYGDPIPTGDQSLPSPVIDSTREGK